MKVKAMNLDRATVACTDLSVGRDPSNELCWFRAFFQIHQHRPVFSDDVTLRGLSPNRPSYGHVEDEHATGFESPMNASKPTC